MNSKMNLFTQFSILLTFRYTRRRTSGYSKSRATFSAGPTPGSVVIQHREYIGEVITVYKMQTQTEQNKLDVIGSWYLRVARQTTLIKGPWQISPSNSLLFPWLAKTAWNWQEFMCNAMAFEFKSTSGGTQTGENPAIGQVLFSCDYNPQAEVIDQSDWQFLENYEYSTPGKPTNDIIYPINTQGTQVNKYSTVPGTGGDKRFDYLGNLYITVSGTAAQNTVSDTAAPGKICVLGKLYVTYSFLLMKPQQRKIPPFLLDDDPTLTGLSSCLWKVPLTGTEEYTQNNIFGVSTNTTTKLAKHIKGLDDIYIYEGSKIIQFGPGVDGVYVFTFTVSGDAVTGNGAFPTWLVLGNGNGGDIEFYKFFLGSGSVYTVAYPAIASASIITHQVAVEVHNKSTASVLLYYSTAGNIPLNGSSYNITCSLFMLHDDDDELD